MAWLFARDRNIIPLAIQWMDFSLVGVSDGRGTTAIPRGAQASIMFPRDRVAGFTRSLVPLLPNGVLGQILRFPFASLFQTPAIAKPPPRASTRLRRLSRTSCHERRIEVQRNSGNKLSPIALFLQDVAQPRFQRDLTGLDQASSPDVRGFLQLKVWVSWRIAENRRPSMGQNTFERACAFPPDRHSIRRTSL